MIEENALPEGWTNAQLGSFTDVIGGSTPSRSESSYFGGDIVWLTPTEVPKDTVSIVLDSKEKLTEAGFKKSGVRWIPIGSVLLTSRASIGYVAIAGTQLTTNQGFASFSLPKGIEPKYLGWWLRSQKPALEDLAGGTTFKEISKAVLKDVFVPLAPENEQRRIVTAIEQQFTRLDAAVTALQHARTKLKRYRAAVLKAAVEGKLTETWRAGHPTTEPASTLLERILVERRAKWEADQRAKGKDPVKGKYVEPARPDAEDLPPVPEGWCWATFEQVSQRVTVGFVGSMKDEYIDNGIPFLRGQNVRPNYFDPTGLKFISREFHEQLAKSALEYRDILVVRSGSVGTACVMPDTYNEANCSDLVIVKQPIYVNSYYTAYYMNSTAQDRVKAKQVGIALTHFNTQSMAIMPLPLPPLLEQQQIVAEVERRLSIVTQLEATVNANLKRAERLRQSILKEAFAGRLVPQDSNDEPASMLLERIRKEREEQKQGSTKKPRELKTISVPRMPDVEPIAIDTSEMEQMDLWTSIGSRE